MHILIVEDEPKLAQLLADYLHQNDWQTTIIGDGAEVVSWVRKHQPDLVLLDIMLPNKDGLAICSEIRTFSQLPIIMLTARVDEIDRILGLEIGADDYVCKPFSPREVVARIKAVFRRLAPQDSKELAENRIALQRDTLTVVIDGDSIQLTAVEFEILAVLMARPGRIVSRNQLMESIYSDYRVVSDRTIDSHIKKIRKKMAQLNPEQEFIHSVYGVGYKFE